MSVHTVDLKHHPLKHLRIKEQKGSRYTFLHMKTAPQNALSGIMKTFSLKYMAPN